jgi:methionine-rich copper-binding protein CopC
MNNRIIRYAVVAMLILLTLAWLVPPALAHTELVSADPPPGAELAAAPSEIRLVFSEPPGAGSSLAVYGEGFQEVLEVSTVIDPNVPEQLVASLPSLAPGTYTVQWDIVGDDGHEVSGSYSFRVTAQVGAVFPGKPWWLAALAGGLVTTMLAVDRLALGGGFRLRLIV